MNESAPTRRVAGKAEAPDAAAQMLEAAVAALKSEVEALIAENGRLFADFAADVSLTFVPSNAFMLDLERGVVHLDLKWFAEQGYTKEQIIWAVFHELSHFRDLAKDPKPMLANWEYTAQKAKKTAAAMMGRMKAEGLPVETTALQAHARRVYNTFYNIFDDIYVNNTVSMRAPRYEAGTKGGDVVASLYREKLFPDVDYVKDPKHLQFIYALLRKEMLPKDDMLLSPEIEKLLDETRITHEKKRYTIREFIAAYLKPQSKADTRAGERYKLIQKYIEPVFDKLLADDLAEWKPPKPEENENKEGGGGEGGGEPGDESEPGSGKGGEGQPGGSSGKGTQEPFAEDYERFEKRHIDQIDEVEMEKFTKREVAKVPPEDDSAEKGAAEAQKKLDEEWCKEHNIDPGALERFRKIEREIAPYLSDLSSLWQRIVYGAGSAVDRKMKGGFRKGVDIDMERTVKSWPEIQSGHMDDARIMRRMSSETRVVNKPERIRVRIVGDDSSSMNRGYIAVQNQAIALLLSSLDEFNTYLNRTRGQTGSDLRVETEVWSFSTDAKLVKPTGIGNPAWNERAAMIETMGKISGRGSSTNDALALGKIRGTMSADDLAKVQSGEVMEIVFLITDGGSNDAAYARRELDALTGRGVIARAFQIGDADSMDQETFSSVWNERRAEPYGVFIGTEIGNLAPAVAEALKRHLSNVSL